VVLRPAAAALALALGLGPATSAASGAPPAAPRPGAIHGQVTVRAPAPAPHARPHAADTTLPAGIGIADRTRTVVYLDPAPQGAFEDEGRTRASLDQVNESFVPYVIAVRAGTEVDFPNRDRTYHNVFSLSKDSEFNLGRYASGRSRAVRFERPGIVRVFCEIHSHMSAFILVFAHRFFAVTDDDGRYRIDGVPPGTYTLAVWNETVHGDPPRRPITIGEGGGDITADFSIR
jgi:plastocyanin